MEFFFTFLGHFWGLDHDFGAVLGTSAPKKPLSDLLWILFISEPSMDPNGRKIRGASLPNLAQIPYSTSPIIWDWGQDLAHEVAKIRRRRHRF